MDRKIREMVALGASYAVNCRPCMENHKRLAIEAGLTPEEMRAAIRVGEAVRQGSGKRSKEFADELFGSLAEEPHRTTEKACCA